MVCHVRAFPCPRPTPWASWAGSFAPTWAGERPSRGITVTTTGSTPSIDPRVAAASQPHRSFCVRVSITDIIDQPGATRPVDLAVPPEEFGAEPWGAGVEAVLDPVELDLHL